MVKKKIGEDLPTTSEKLGEDLPTTSGEVSFEKYFQLKNPGLTRYVVAYLGSRFRGIMKTTDSWNEEVKKIMEEGDR